jgi:DNA polymerase elongation subunit (family B)
MNRVTKKNVHEKARVLGVLHKLDPMEDSREYLIKWDVLLDKFRVFKDKCKMGQWGQQKNINLSNISESDIKSLTTDQSLFEQVTSELYEDHDGVFPEPNGYTHDDITILETTTNSKYGDYIKEDVHIIDVDYEYDMVMGMYIILYTRVIGCDDTIFVRVPYHDYFYIEITEELGFDKIKKAVKGYCWYLKKKYNKMIKNPKPGVVDFRKHPCNMNMESEFIISMEIVDDLKTMYTYQPDPQKFVKITTINPTVTADLFYGLSKKYIGDYVETFRWENDIRIPNGREYFPEMKFFEAKKTDVINKFLVEHGTSGCGAIRVKGYRHPTNNFSTCTIAVDATEVVALPHAPFFEPRTFFYDIECLSLDINEFPTSDKCPIIQISYVCTKGQCVVSKGVLCLEETPGYEWFDDEGTMLTMFAKKIIDFNPDYLTGFNSNCFDMPYIIDRMRVLGVYDIAGQFSRRNNFRVPYNRDFRQSKQFGTKEIVEYVTPGRVMFDQMEIFKGNAMIRLRSYSLKAICAEFLGDDNKEDLAYRDIPDLFKTPGGRVKIASYCLQDSILLKKLDDKTMLGVDIAGQAKVQGITANMVLNRGLVYRIMCKIKQYTERYKFLIPTFSKKQFPVSPTYQGATVLNCDAGFYTDPVVVLDFASLYPSLVRSYNLDYTTIAKDTAQIERYPERFQKFDNGYAFVKSEYHRGILPMIEAELAVERKNAKEKMKNAKDDVEEAVWNAIQGGIKIVMNSIYGLAGSPTSTVPCVPIASTITFLGRYNLGCSKEYVESNYCRITGEPPERKARVIYGDTGKFIFF